MKKALYVLLALMFLAVIGCSAAYDYDPNQSSATSSTQSDYASSLSDMSDLAVEFADETEVLNRKIIYEVDMTFHVTSLSDAAHSIQDLLESDEWVDRVSLSSTVYSYTLRIKTDRLDEFCDALMDLYLADTYVKNGIDISLQYQDKTDRITSLEAQYDRLLVLYESASLSDLIIINEQLSDIEVELASLRGDLAQYDSLIEYSEVNIVFRGTTVVTDSPFFNRLANAFVDGINALVSFFDGFFIVLATILPFAIVFGGAGIVVWKVLAQKKRVKLQKKAEVPQEDTK